MDSTSAHPGPYTLRSHEKLSATQVGDGIPSFDVTYEILRDGKPLSFHEHMDVVRRLNAAEALAAPVTPAPIDEFVCGQCGRKHCSCRQTVHRSDNFDAATGRRWA